MDVDILPLTKTYVKSFDFIPAKASNKLDFAGPRPSAKLLVTMTDARWLDHMTDKPYWIWPSPPLLEA